MRKPPCPANMDSQDGALFWANGQTHGEPAQMLSRREHAPMPTSKFCAEPYLKQKQQGFADAEAVLSKAYSCVPQLHLEQPCSKQQWVSRG